MLMLIVIDITLSIMIYNVKTMKQNVKKRGGDCD